MPERQAALPTIPEMTLLTIPEMTLQVPLTRMSVSIIMCYPHLLNIVQAVPLRETKVWFLFPHESLGCFQSLPSRLGDFCLCDIFDLSHSYNMPLPRLSLPCLQTCMILTPFPRYRLQQSLKMKYLPLKCYYCTSLPPPHNGRIPNPVFISFVFPSLLL